MKSIRKYIVPAVLLVVCVGAGFGAGRESALGGDTQRVADFNDGFMDGQRDIREQLSSVIERNPDECWIRENIPGIPDEPQWCKD